MLFAVELDVRAAVLGEQDAVALFDGERKNVAVLVALAGADGDDFALNGLLFNGIGDVQTTSGLVFLVEALDDHSII